MKEKTERARYWEGVIQEHAQSGSTVKAFCKEGELSEASFYWWRRELDGKNKPRRRTKRTADASVRDSFVQLVTSQDGGASPSGIAIRVDGRLSVVLDRQFNGDTLRAVLAVVLGTAQ